MRTYLFSIIIIFLASNLFAQKVFQSGEELKYEMSYGWITGGTAVLKLKKVTYQNKKVFHVKAVGKTVGVADKLYRVYDIYESYFDIETMKPYKSIRNISEEDYRWYNEVRFLYPKNEIISKRSGRKKVKAKTFDVISAFYYLRQYDFSKLKKGDVIRIRTYFTDKPFELVIRFKGYETIKLDFGKIKCMKFSPLVEKGTFENEEALDVWISADRNHVPVRAKVNFFVGSFTGDLVSYSGLKYPLVIIKK